MDEEKMWWEAYLIYLSKDRDGAAAGADESLEIFRKKFPKALEPLPVEDINRLINSAITARFRSFEGKIMNLLEGFKKA